MGITKSSTDQSRPGLYGVLKDVPDYSGFEAGHNVGYSNGYADGQTAERDSLLPTLWEAIIVNEPRSYKNAFYNLFFDNTIFKPNKIFLITDAYSMFENCSFELEEERQVDLIEYEKQIGVELFNLSNCERLNRAFYKCGLFKTINVVDLSNNPSLLLAFAHSNIQRIEYFIPPTEIVLTNCFSNAKKLSYVGVCDVVCKSVTLQHSPLENESAISFIKNLKNYSGTEYEFIYSLLFSEEVWENLDALGNVSPNGNTWREYCYDKGWGT